MSLSGGCNVHLLSLAARLRQWQDELVWGGGFDPVKHFIVVRHPGGFRFGGVPVDHLFQLLEDANRRGAFADFSEIRAHLRPSNQTESLGDVTADLERLGFDSADRPEPWTIERLAAAIETLARTAGHGTAASRKTDELESESAAPWEPVDLDQIAGIIHRKKSSLQKHYINKGRMPAPRIQGTGGRKSLWHWPDVRPWLMETFSLSELPEKYPKLRRT